MEERFYQTQSFKKKFPFIGLTLVAIILFWAETRLGLQWVGAFLRIFVLQRESEFPSLQDTARIGFLLVYCLLNLSFFYVLILLLVSQFILPVRKSIERWNVFARLLEYTFGLHGPALFVKEGKIVARPGELEKRIGPGLIKIDSTSAVILEKPRTLPVRSSPSTTSQGELAADKITYRYPSHIRVHGPGITFIDTGDKIRGVADLRPQLRFRSGIHALSSDGIEITTDVSTVFSIGQTPDVLRVGYCLESSWDQICVINLPEAATKKSSTQDRERKIYISALTDELDELDKKEIYQYVSGLPESEIPNPPSKPLHTTKQVGHYYIDPERIFAAVYSKAQDVKKGEYVEWTELPPYTATDVFRNLLSHEVYEHLYLPEEDEKFPLIDLKSNFSRKVRNLGILSYQFIRNRDGTPFTVGQEWNEEDLIFYPVQELKHPKVLRSRGIKVLYAGFSDLKPVDPQVRETLLTHWRARWKRDADLTRAEYDLQAIRVRNQARAQAQREMVNTLTQIFSNSPHSQEALALRVYQALEKAASDPATRKLLPPNMIQMLGNLQKWLIPKEETPTEGISPEKTTPEQTTPDRTALEETRTEQTMPEETQPEKAPPEEATQE